MQADRANEALKAQEKVASESYIKKFNFHVIQNQTGFLMHSMEMRDFLFRGESGIYLIQYCSCVNSAMKAEHTKLWKAHVKAVSECCMKMRVGMGISEFSVPVCFQK